MCKIINSCRGCSDGVVEIIDFIPSSLSSENIVFVVADILSCVTEYKNTCKFKGKQVNEIKRLYFLNDNLICSFNIFHLQNVPLIWISFHLCVCVGNGSWSEQKRILEN